MSAPVVFRLILAYSTLVCLTSCGSREEAGRAKAALAFHEQCGAELASWVAADTRAGGHVLIILPLEQDGADSVNHRRIQGVRGTLSPHGHDIRVVYPAAAEHRIDPFTGGAAMAGYNVDQLRRWVEETDRMVALVTFIGLPEGCDIGTLRDLPPVYLMTFGSPETLLPLMGTAGVRALLCYEGSHGNASAVSVEAPRVLDAKTYRVLRPRP